MKFITLFSLIAVLMFAVIGHSTVNANIFGDIAHGFRDAAHDVAHVAVKAADDTAKVAVTGAKDVASGLTTGAKATAEGVSIGAKDTVKALGTAAQNAGPVIQKVDKVANEIEPVAKVVATGMEIGELAGAK